MSTLATVVDQHLLIGLVVAAVFSIVLTLCPVLQRTRYLWLISLMGPAAYYGHSFPGFVVAITIAYAALRALSRQAIPSHRWRWACLALFSLITVFTLGRVLNWGRWMVPRVPVPLALYSLDMWLALRLVTLFWEVGSGAIAAPAPSRYIFWTCLPLTLSGPMLRYSQMPAAISVDRRLWKSRAWWMEVAAGAGTMIAGVALGAATRLMYTRWPQARFWDNLASIFFTAPFGFYLTTAGYLRLMEAMGRPCGFQLPMSFNFPLGRENISAFWANWNMTATAVFRDYLFYNRWGLQGYHVYVNTIIVFVMVGLWHAANAYWILWGFLHGLLFCGFLFWRKHAKQLAHLPLRGTPLSQTAARILTYVLVCACWYLPSKILQKLAMAQALLH